MRLIKSFLTVLMLVHIMACFWYFTAKLEGFGPDTWVVRHGYTDESNEELYTASFYWAMTTLSTVGYGDITAETSLERIIAILWMFISVLYLSFVVGNLTSMLS